MPTVLKLSANAEQFIKEMERASGALGKFTARMNLDMAKAYSKVDQVSSQMERGFGRISNSLKSFSVAGFFGITVPLGLAARFGSEAFAQYDGLKKALSTLEPTLAGVNTRLEALRVIAKEPGIGFQEAIQGEVRLRSVGLSVKETTGILREFANAVATTGGGKTQLNEITYQMGQMAAKGKVLSQDLRPIIEAAPAVSKALQKLFGTVSSEEISNQLTAKGQNSKDFIRQIVAELEKAPRVTGGWRTQLDNTADSIFVMSSRIFEATDKLYNLQGGLSAITTSLESGVSSFLGMSEGMQKLTLGVVGFIAVAPLAAYAVAKLIDVFTGLTSKLLTTRGAIGAATVALTFMIGVYAQHSAQIKEFTEQTKSLNEVRADAVAKTNQETTKMASLVSAIKETKVGSEEYLELKRQILSIAPSFNKFLTDTTANFKGLAAAAKSYADNLINVAEADELVAKISKNTSTIEKLDKDPNGSASILDSFVEGTTSVLTVGVPSIAKSLVVPQFLDSNFSAIKRAVNESIKDYNDRLKSLAEDRKYQLELANIRYRKQLEDVSKKIVTAPINAPTSTPKNPNKDKTTEQAEQAEKKQKKVLDDRIAAAKELRQKQEELRAEVLSQLGEGELGAATKGVAKSIIDDINKLTELDSAMSKLRIKVIKNRTGTLTEIQSLEGSISGLEDRMAKRLEDLTESADKKIAKGLQKDKKDRDKKIAELEKDKADKERDIEDLRAEQERLLNTAAADVASGFIAQLTNEESQGFKKALKRQLAALGDYAVQLGLKYAVIIKLQKALFAGNPTLGQAYALIAGGVALKAASSSIQINRLARGGVTSNPIFTILGDNPSGKEMALPFERNQEFASDIAKFLGGNSTESPQQLVATVTGKQIDMVLTRYKNGN
jgi:tape measure domain-containing protein